MPSRKAALVLFAIFILLLAAVIIQGRSGRGAVASSPRPTPFFTVAANEVARVEVSSKDGSLVLTKGADGQWSIEAPVKAMADQSQVAEVVSEVSALQATRFLPPDAGKASEYGLDPPASTITIVLAGGASTRLEVGDLNPDSSGRYVRLSGQSSIALVDPYPLDRLTGMVKQPPLPPTPLPTTFISPVPNGTP